MFSPSSYQPVSPFDVRIFRPALVKECMHAVLMEHLYNKEYQQATASEDTKLLVELIKNKIKDLGYDRYKIVVQVYIGEQRGQAVKLSCRKFWDSDTDNFTVDTYMNDSLFCVAMAFGVYYY